MGAKGGQKTIVEPHRHEGVSIARGKEDMLCTKSMALEWLCIARSASLSIRLPRCRERRGYNYMSTNRAMNTRLIERLSQQELYKLYGSWLMPSTWEDKTHLKQEVDL